MPHARLTHATRGTLPFRQGQQHEDERSGDMDITAELGTDTKPLVNARNRERTFTVRGTVTGLKRARDSGASDSFQALATYADLLESHVDEFQGDHTAANPGYQFEDDQLGYTKNAILESIEWSMKPGRIHELDYQATVRIGKGTMTTRDIQRRNPNVNVQMDAWAILDGIALEGMRDYRVQRAIGVEQNAVFSGQRDTAETNQFVVEDGEQRTITFEGVISGSLADRRDVDQALDSLNTTQNSVTLKTKFPGYSVPVFVTGYKSTLEQQRGGNSHRYRVEMVEGKRA